jgi:hypothetical protein
VCRPVFRRVQIRNNENAGLEVLPALGMKNIIFLDVTSCSLVEVHPLFESADLRQD